MKPHIVWFSDWTVLMDEDGNILLEGHRLDAHKVLRVLGIETKALDASGDEESEMMWHYKFDKATPEERLKMFNELWSIK